MRCIIIPSCVLQLLQCADLAVLSDITKDGDMDIICYGAVTNYGATVNGEIEALGHLYHKSAESFP